MSATPTTSPAADRATGVFPQPRQKGCAPTPAECVTRALAGIPQNITDTARALGRSETTILSMVKRGHLRITELGPRLKFIGAKEVAAIIRGDAVSGGGETVKDGANAAA